MDCSPPGSSVHGFSRQKYWSGWPFLSSGYLFTSLPKSLTSSHLWDANDHPPLPGRRGEKTLTTGGPGKEQGTNKLPPTRILQLCVYGLWCFRDYWYGVPGSSCGFPAVDLGPDISRISASFQWKMLFRDHSLNGKGAYIKLLKGVLFNVMSALTNP